MFRSILAVFCAALIAPGGLILAGQQDPGQQPPAQEQPEQPGEPEQPEPPPPPPEQPLSPEQLDGLVAPVALYPDSLLSQVLVAATYPLEVVEAYQWLQQNRNLQGQDLANAAKQQNWDASIQALVAFPDALKLLNDDIRWTTDLGNAFLGQQADVMAAVQRLRAQAQQSGKLNSNPEVNVATQTENGQSAIEIQPANPQVVYVPVYNPAFFWGTLYPYPPLFYPAIGVGWGFGAGISLGFFFGAGCCGWGGWGWGPSWFGHTVIVNNEFFHRYGFNHFNGGGWGRGVWRHDPAHRLGVPYADHRMTEHFRSAGRAPAIRRSGGELRNAPRFNGPSERTGNHMIPERSNNHGIFGGVTNGARVRVQSDHGFSSMRSAGRGSGGARGSGGHPSGGPRGGRR